jgi:hypothetical protein
VQICAQLCSRIRLIYLTYGYLRVISTSPLNAHSYSSPA